MACPSVHLYELLDKNCVYNSVRSTIACAFTNDYVTYYCNQRSPLWQQRARRSMLAWAAPPWQLHTSLQGRRDYSRFSLDMRACAFDEHLRNMNALYSP